MVIKYIGHVLAYLHNNTLLRESRGPQREACIRVCPFM